MRLTANCRPWAFVPLCAALALAAGGCSQQTIDDAGSAVESAKDDAKEAAGDAAQAAGDAADATGRAVGDAAEATGRAAGDAADAAGAAAAGVGQWLGEGYTAAADKARAALDGVDGGGQLLTGIKDLFAKAHKALSGVTDSASAQAAEAEITKLTGSVDDLAKKTEGLPPEAKTAVEGVVKQGVAKLKELVDKVLAMPGVDAIKPKLDELVGKMEALAGGGSNS